MITGTHVLFYSDNPEKDREFFRDVLQFRSVDAGGGWLIFAMPPAEAALHPFEDGENRTQSRGGPSLMGAVIYLMCMDLPAEMKRLAQKGVEFSPVEIARWGSKTTFRLPSGGELGLYQPTHPTAMDLKT